MLSPSTFLVLVSHLGLFSPLQPHYHEQIVLHSDTPASRYSTVKSGSYSRINTTWTRRHKQLSSASLLLLLYIYSLGNRPLASSILKDFHMSQKVTLSPQIKPTKIHQKRILPIQFIFFTSTAANRGFVCM